MTPCLLCNKRFDVFIYWIKQNTLQMLPLTLLSSRYFITFYLCFTLLVKKKIAFGCEVICGCTNARCIPIFCCILIAYLSTVNEHYQIVLAESCETAAVLFRQLFDQSFHSHHFLCSKRTIFLCNKGLLPAL